MIMNSSSSPCRANHLSQTESGMNYSLRVLLFVFASLTLSFSLFGERAHASCNCPKIDCSPCEKQDGLTFYSEKCDGPAGIRSCSRPTCVPKDPLPASCL